MKKIVLFIPLLLLLLFTFLSCGDKISRVSQKREKKDLNSKVQCKLPYNISKDKFILYYYPTEKYQNNIEMLGGEDYWMTILDDNTFNLDSIYLYLISKNITCQIVRDEYFLFCRNGKIDTLRREFLRDSLFGFLLFEKNKKPIQINYSNFSKLIK